ncbi:hypothetical protein N8475_03385 [Winogradskyella sp.]|jgi:uncharacterized tellurite resistance protein B-like protein|nr:hypothetical protein [Winogradskyella sp.]
MDKITQITGFYEALAHLFYSAAIADKSFIRNEKLKIIELVESHWNTKIQNTESKEIIYETLKELISKKESSDGAFKVFETFFNTNSSFFTAELRSTLIKTVNGIANASVKRSKGELIVLGRLHNLLNITS